MINVDFLNIDNAKLVGRLLPFWARGRKISMILQALLHPLTTPHEAFKKWALDKYIACHITAQRASLEWYLKFCLKSHFFDKDDKFLIVQGDESLACFSNDIWTNELYWNNDMLWGSNGTVTGNEAVVYAPKIVNTINYNNGDYERDIRNIMSKYMINFNNIDIIIMEEYKI